MNNFERITQSPEVLAPYVNCDVGKFEAEDGCAAEYCEDCRLKWLNAPAEEDEPPSDGGWISVTDRLPVPGERVLMAFSGFLVTEGCINREGEWMRFEYPVGKVFDTGVTHWMPMPKPPEV